MNKNRVFADVRAKYVGTIERQANEAAPGTGWKDVLLRIVHEAGQISDPREFLGRHEDEWRGKLGEATDVLQHEVERRRDQWRRLDLAEDRRDFEEIVNRAQARWDQAEDDWRLCDRLEGDLQRWLDRNRG